MSTSGTPSTTTHSWPARVLGFLLFIVHFTRELVMSNIAIAKSVLFQKNTDLAPGFVIYPIKGLSRFEILVLTHSITLTPGTASVMISDDFTELTVHAFDVRDPDAVCASIKSGLEKPLLAWTR